MGLNEPETHSNERVVFIIIFEISSMIEAVIFHNGCTYITRPH